MPQETGPIYTGVVSPYKRSEGYLRLVFPAIALGLAWAVRGHFGHEWGAAWAGGIGGIAILIAAGREDWLTRLPVIAVFSAVGWGAGGMMSYGLIVGYGRGVEFFNVYYGLFMLGVVGGLYGFIGGGLFGAALETTERNKPDWAGLFTQMVAGALICWGLLIYQLEWFMTPPRSELWAACLGAALALAWYLGRAGFVRALRVACFSALGAGFGFAFGNFLQVAGTVSGIVFNWWNVMEFSLGFFGGLGMAYGVFSHAWPESALPSRPANSLALLVLLVALPATTLAQAFDAANFRELGEELGLANPIAFARNQHLLGWGMWLAFAGLGWTVWQRGSSSLLFFAFTALYILESHVRKGIFAGAGGAQIEQYLYWLDYAALAFLWNYLVRMRAFPTSHQVSISWKGWCWIVPVFISVLAVLAFVAVHLHDGLPGAQVRF